jgi:hypothetical protein
MTANTDWVREGAAVAEVIASNNRGASGVYLATIKRLTATQIHLDNGNRYNRQTLAPIKGNTGTGAAPRVSLRSGDDPDVLRSRALKLLDQVSMTASRAHRNGALNVADVLTALDEIERAVAAARQAITGKEN